MFDPEVARIDIARFVSLANFARCRDTRAMQRDMQREHDSTDDTILVVVTVPVREKVVKGAGIGGLISTVLGVMARGKFDVTHWDDDLDEFAQAFGLFLMFAAAIAGVIWVPACRSRVKTMM